jgi:DNA-binding protein HU-beta
MCQKCPCQQAARLPPGAPGKAHEFDIKVERLLSFLSRIIFPKPRAHFAALRRASIMAGKAMNMSGKAGRPVTLKHLAARLAADHELTKRAGEAILGDLVTLITKHLKKGERIRISGFGILQVRTRAARMGRNPATGEAIKIKASKKVAFRPAKHLKMAI